MQVNENIYGAQNTWLNAPLLSSGRMKCKAANFTGGNDISTASMLSAGNTAGKTPRNALIDRSIATSALGTESLYSHIMYWKDSDTQYIDDEATTEFFFCTTNNTTIPSTREYIDSGSPRNFWKTYASGDNGSDLIVPITEMNPKKILYRLDVAAVNAQGEPAPYSSITDNYRFTFIGDYDRDINGIKTNYPYIQAARLSPCVDNSNSETPSRSSMSSSSTAFGIAINREFTTIPNDDLKINYCQFIDVFDRFNIPIYGHRGYFSQSYDYNVVLAPAEDIQTGIIEYSHEYWIGHLYDAAFKEYLIRQAACFGVFFRVTATGGALSSLPLDSPDVYLGVLDDYGIGHGEYTHGEENRTNNIWNWDSYSNSPYDYTVTPDTNTYSNTTSFNTIGGLSTMFKRYVLNGTGVSALGGDLFKIGDDVVVDQSGSYQDYQNIMLNDFLTNNPIDAIISLKKFPLKNIPHDATIENLRLGKVQISTAGYTMPYNSFMYLFKPVDIFPRFGNCFLDYAPYTSIQLYIPFCGTIDLNPDDVMGKRVDVQLLIDFTTGNCDAFISVGNLVIKTASGQCAIDIPVTGTESATVDSQITNGIIQGKNARAKATTDFATANFTPAGLAQSIINPFSAAQNRFENQTNRAQTEYNVTHTQTPLRTIGTCTPVGGWAIDFTCRLIITYPTGAVIDNNVPPRFNDSELQKYGHLIGFATVDSATMNKYAGGLVVADSINLDGVSATDAEKELIIAAVKEGCYI